MNQSECISMCCKMAWFCQEFLLTCRRPPAHACCYLEYVWAAPSLEASGKYLVAGWQPSGHSGSVSSKWWNVPGPSCQTNTVWDEEWAQAGRGSCLACSLETRIRTVSFQAANFFWHFERDLIPFVLSALLPLLINFLLTFSYSPQHKDARLFNHPLRMEEQFFE